MKHLLLSALLVATCAFRAECFSRNVNPPVIPMPNEYVQGKGTFQWTDSAVTYTLDANAALPSQEAYTITVGPKQVQVTSQSEAGLFYARQTLQQLREAGNGKIRSCTISDSPRFPYRGIMIDVSRHFRSIDFLKKQIDLLATIKINRLHLHLTDAAGWRLEIKKYPELTGYAAWRPQETWKEWNEGGNKYCQQTDEQAHGGFYTQDEMKELIRYAAERFITIVPEIEMPSHSDEVLATYPELSCTHKPYGQPDFCIGNEETFRFLENVLSEVIDLFPSEYIHIGGDEASKASWKTCPLCQERMRQNNLKDVDELQSYLIRRIEKSLNSKGKRLLGWDEILQGGVAPNATVMSWRGEQGGIDAVRSSHRAIMTPGVYCYFDSYQDAPSTQPEAIGGYLPLDKVYSYEPIPDSLSAAERELIYGVQANLWTEYIPTAEHAEYMLYPRALALSEVAWTRPESKSWPDFKERVLLFTPRMQEKGYHVFDYAKETGNRPESLKPVKHLAIGKPVSYRRPYWKTYPANGERTLNDGIRGGWNYNDKRWLGFVGSPRMDVVIDLEKEQTVHYIGADFMQLCGPGVFMPAKVTISVSTDGTNYEVLSEQTHKVVKDSGVSFKSYGWKGKARARYVRYQAEASEEFGGVQFVDEIIVR